MPDNMKLAGKSDRDRVSAKESYEMRRLAKKVELPVPLVEKVTKQVGPMRDKVEKKLNEMKRNGRR